MFALLAAIVWLLAAFHVGFGTVDMLLLGLGLFALNFAVPVALPWRRE